MVGYGLRDGISRFIRRSQHQQQDTVIPQMQPHDRPTAEAKDATKDRAVDDLAIIPNQSLDDLAHLGHQ